MNIKQWFLNLYLSFLPLIRDHSKVNKKYPGLYKDTEDDRDYMYFPRSTETPQKPVFFSLSINPYPYVKSQGKWRSCASHAISTGVEIMHDLNQTKYKTVQLSERYHYYYARKGMNRLPENVGMTLRTMMKTAQEHGISPEKLCPYIDSEMNNEPAYFAKGFSDWWKIVHYFRLANQQEIKDTLLDNKPVIIGIKTNASFMNFSGDIEVRDNETTYGGHAIVVYGYDDEEQCFLCINSWGTRYKDRGVMTLPYEYVDRYGFDFWTFSIQLTGGQD